MMKPGDAKADMVRDTFDRNRRKRDDALLRRTIRAEMRSNPDEEENSAVVEQRALEAQTKTSDPPSGYGQQAAGLIRAVRGWPQAVFGLGLLALLAWAAWLRWH